jgi:hypothetical protein
MLNLVGIAARAAEHLWRAFDDDPLSKPLGRVPDCLIDKALSERGLNRVDLFTLQTAQAPHRKRVAAMMAIKGISAVSAVEENWNALKEADHRCAYCDNARRCSRWLNWNRDNDAPRLFCPNSETLDAFEQKRAELAGNSDAT